MEYYCSFVQLLDQMLVYRLTTDQAMTFFIVTHFDSVRHQLA